MIVIIPWKSLWNAATMEVENAKILTAPLEFGIITSFMEIIYTRAY